MNVHNSCKISCNHTHNHNHTHIHPVVSNLKIAFVLNLSFTVIEIFGGIWTNSIAILSDAVHDLGDSMAIGMSLWMEKYSKKGRSPQYSYGYKRFSPLAALLTSLVLLLSSLFIIFNTIPRFIHPQSVQTTGMLWMALLGIAFNGLAVLRLKKGSNSLNQHAVMLHLLEDALGWLAVLIGSIIMYYTKWYWIDPLLSLTIASFILYNASKNLKSVVSLFLQTIPQSIDQHRITEELMKLPSVKGVHDFHCWALDENFNVATLHVVVERDILNEQQQEVRQAALHILRQHQVQHPTIHMEYEHEVCSLVWC